MADAPEQERANITAASGSHDHEVVIPILHPFEDPLARSAMGQNLCDWRIRRDTRHRVVEQLAILMLALLAESLVVDRAAEPLYRTCAEASGSLAGAVAANYRCLVRRSSVSRLYRI